VLIHSHSALTSSRDRFSPVAISNLAQLSALFGAQPFLIFLDYESAVRIANSAGTALRIILLTVSYASVVITDDDRRRWRNKSDGHSKNWQDEREGK
jgi:hypothetical protein